MTQQEHCVLTLSITPESMPAGRALRYWLANGCEPVREAVADAVAFELVTQAERAGVVKHVTFRVAAVTSPATPTAPPELLDALRELIGEAQSAVIMLNSASRHHRDYGAAASMLDQAIREAEAAIQETTP